MFQWKLNINSSSSVKYEKPAGVFARECWRVYLKWNHFWAFLESRNQPTLVIGPCQAFGNFLSNIKIFIAHSVVYDNNFIEMLVSFLLTLQSSSCIFIRKVFLWRGVEGNILEKFINSKSSKSSGVNLSILGKNQLTSSCILNFTARAAHRNISAPNNLIWPLNLRNITIMYDVT